MKSIPIVARFLLVGIAVGIMVVLSSAWKESERSKRIEGEVNVLRMEADRIRNENRSLSEKLSYFATSDFEEREAKEKLGMKKKDEEALSVEVGSPKMVSSNEEYVPPADFDGKANYEKWVQFFLGIDRNK